MTTTTITIISLPHVLLVTAISKSPSRDAFMCSDNFETDDQPLGCDPAFDPERKNRADSNTVFLSIHNKRMRRRRQTKGTSMAGDLLVWDRGCHILLGQSGFAGNESKSLRSLWMY
ncbi:hypothetical protein ACH5RR_027562 [Cinchona calisaya]|uniref:Secreted protein n=1 Tax=Cinchona calisaya TaxID=153742 RepID=A0ABD2Z982_9GENT